MATGALATGHVVTAAEFNAKLEAPVATAEIADAAITAAKLGPLAVTGAKLGIQPHALAYAGADISIANITATVVALPLELADTEAMHDLAVSNSRLTCVTAGLYLINAAASWTAHVTGFRQIYVLLNGAIVIARDTRVSINGTDPTSQTITRLWRLAVGDYVELGAYQNSGGALTLYALASYSPHFGMVRLSA